MAHSGMPSRFTRDTDRGPQRQPPDAPAAMYHFQANQGNQNAGPRRDTNRRPPRTFDFRHPPPKASERPLLTARHNSSEALTFPTNHTKDKYREVADLSDADEAEMDISASGDEEHRSKRLRLEANSTLTSETPRWSNPDPYTSLPPVDDSSRKRKDVVKLIRRARVETAVAPGTVVANDQDFISFDFDGDDVDAGLYLPPPGAPTGPKADFPARTTRTTQQTAQHSMPLGKRKRDDSDNRLHPTPSQKKQPNGNDMVLLQWQPTSNVNPTPWLQPVHGRGLEAPGIALHKEVIDFYEWVKPRDFEHAVRADVITRLQKAFERLEPGGRLKPFGSFAAGLYLPTGDMDLVFLRSSFRGTRISSTGKLAKPRIETVTNFAKFIRNQGLAQGTVKPILHAKVPIIKFVERISGLKVDLSFDNDTGVTANETFHKWKVQYPAMPILVSIIKHFLMIRGLNDVAFGGLGGFSVICLVTSLVQHFPSTSQPPNLGLMLLEFFNLYGNLFNRHDIAIRLDPPSYISKGGHTYLVQGKERPDCLSIIDPHRPDNNISVGTHEIQRITDCFAKAHESLQRRLQNKATHPGSAGSLLEDILGGNFSAYELQRQSLYDLHARMLRKSSAVPPPPPAAIPTPEIPPPPPPSGPRAIQSVDLSVRQSRTSVQGLGTALRYNSNNGGSSTLNGVSKAESEDQTIGRGERKALNRALRFQELRPDILNIASMTRLTLDEAVKLGGYENAEKMQMDLDKRAKAIGKNLSMIKA